MVIPSAHRPWALCASALALALVCWPVCPARCRIRALLPGARGADGARARLARWLRVEPRRLIGVLAGVALVGGLLAGIGGVLAALVIAGVGYRRWQCRVRYRRQVGEVAALLDAVGVLAAELRAGAHPASAARAASAGDRAVHRVLASVAAAARLGAEVPALLKRHAVLEPSIVDELNRVAAAWSLAERHGAALAELMDAVRADLEARLRLSGQVKALLAGPRASAAVLAGLPLLGIALGQGIGAHPWRILTATAAGQCLLVLGTALVAAGVLWSGRITGRTAL
jgi:tight adherence protein B